MPNVFNAKFDADISAITKSLHAMDQIPAKIMTSIAKEVEESARNALLGVFAEAIDQQSEDAFPAEFAGHMLDIVADAPFNVVVSPTSFEIDFDFNVLGNREDLKRAFHQGALLADGKTKLDGPYTGQELKNEDPARRHIFWGAMQKGLASAPNPVGPGHIPIQPNAWEETKRKYIEIWGDKAPQWLYLEFGQQAWDPQIRAFPIIEYFTRELQSLASDIFESRVIEEIEIAQREGAQLSQYGARLTSDSNLLGPSGKPRRKGQFYPIR